jgi:hypothetical protein
MNIVVDFLLSTAKISAMVSSFLIDAALLSNRKNRKALISKSIGFSVLFAFSFIIYEVMK